MKTNVEFDSPSLEDVELLIERFLEDYPDSNHKITEDETIIFDNDNWNSIDDVDTFLCEEICHQFETYCYISDEESKKEYYYDEEDEWVLKQN